MAHHLPTKSHLEGPLHCIPFYPSSCQGARSLYLDPSLQDKTLEGFRILNCTSTCRPCHFCTYREGGYFSSHPSPSYLITFDTSRRCTPYTDFCCPASHKAHDGKQNTSPRNRCTLWEGEAATSWQLYYLPPRAGRIATGPRDAGLKGGLLSSLCNEAPAWGSSLTTWFNSSSPHSACAPPGYLFLCGPPQNELPNKESPNGVYHQPPTCSPGQCTLGFLGPRDVSITVHNITHPRSKRGLALILAGTGASVAGKMGGIGERGRVGVETILPIEIKTFTQCKELIPSLGSAHSISQSV
uniref:Uncharacterized protein n=1 Tax=Rhinolophus ferrumequinum TaxID=59479 RepID=A0A671E236_RHIFE